MHKTNNITRSMYERSSKYCRYCRLTVDTNTTCLRLENTG